MKENIATFIIGTIGLSLIISSAIDISKEINKKEQYIQQLEQSLNEQKQEKEVYMKMLENADLLKGECNDRDIRQN